MNIEDKFSKHMREDRKNRFDFINSTIGLGEPVARYRKDRDEYGDAITTLTNTGVIVIQSEVTEQIITMYIASISQAKEVWNKAKNKGNCKMPSSIWAMINYNNNTEWYHNRVRG